MLLIPTLAALGLGLWRLDDAYAVMRTADRAETLAHALPSTYRLALLLQAERDAAGTGVDMRPITAATDQAVAQWRPLAATIDTTGQPSLRTSVDQLEGGITGLPHLRALKVGQRRYKDYTGISDALLALSQGLPSLGSDSISRQIAALNGIGSAVQALQNQRVLVLKALTSGGLGRADAVSLAEAVTAWKLASQQFEAGASPRATAAFATIDKSSMRPLQRAVASVLAGGPPGSTGVTPTVWKRQSGDYVAQAIPVVVSAAEDLSTAVAEREDADRRAAIIAVAVILLTIGLGLLELGLASRSIVRPLRRLQLAALEVVPTGLPERAKVDAVVADVSRRSPGRVELSSNTPPGVTELPAPRSVPWVERIAATAAPAQPAPVPDALTEPLDDLPAVVTDTTVATYPVQRERNWLEPITDPEELLTAFLSGRRPERAVVEPEAVPQAAGTAPEPAHSPVPTWGGTVTAMPAADPRLDAAEDHAPIFAELTSEWFVRPEEPETA